MGIKRVDSSISGKIDIYKLITPQVAGKYDLSD